MIQKFLCHLLEDKMCEINSVTPVKFSGIVVSFIYIKVKAELHEKKLK